MRPNIRNSDSVAEARAEAVRLLDLVHREGAYLHVILNESRRSGRISPQRLALVERWVKGVLEHQQDIDTALKGAVRGDFLSLPAEIQEVLRIAVYQLWYLERSKAAGVVSESVDLAKRLDSHGMASLTNAVLRKLSSQEPPGGLQQAQRNDSTGDLGSSFDHPKWIFDRWVNQFGQENAEAICRANNEPWPMALRVNTLKIDQASLVEQLKLEGIETSPSELLGNCLRVESRERKFFVHELNTFQQGSFLIQDESSALVASLLAPKPGDLVFDLCSAPGGKTCVMGMLMENRGQIIAYDRNASRLKLVRENCARLGVTCVETMAADATQLHPEELADAVLLDAPCSGFGTLGRKVDIRWSRKESDFADLFDLQRELILASANYVKPGGRLAYSTCSIERVENEELVEYFLSVNDSFTLVPLPDWLPQNCRSTCGRFMRTFPHLHKCAGAFAAILERK